MIIYVLGGEFSILIIAIGIAINLMKGIENGFNNQSTLR